jgi:hypothetical protein
MTPEERARICWEGMEYIIEACIAQAIIRLAVEAEREACAKLAERINADDGDPTIGAQIRARGNK